MKTPTLILASTSPRRRELVKLITDNFVSVSPTSNEISEGDPITIATTNASLKGKSIEGNFVLACDTIVCLDNYVLGKGIDYDNAFKSLQLLNNKTHSVISGVYIRYHDKEYVFYDESFVKFKNLSKDEIDYYIKNYKPYDKAGSYGIQDNFVVESYKGSLNNIIGLPTEKIIERLKEIIC